MTAFQSVNAFAELWYTVNSCFLFYFESQFLMRYFQTLDEGD